MNEHDNIVKDESETKPTQNEETKEAYDIYQKEGRPQGHAKQNWLAAEAQLQRAGSKHPDHHAHMAADFQKRFWISLALTLKILKGLFKELKSRQPGMMTLVAVAITTAYLYCSAVVFGLTGKMFSWELATLVDIMLVGHWIEMKSVIGASMALEALAKLMPDGGMKDVPLGDLAVGDKVLIKPGEKIPAVGVVVEGESSVNETMLTGESNSVSKKTSDKLIGGAMNGEGSLTIEVKGTGKDSFLSQVIDLVKQAQKSKSKIQNLADTAAMWLTLIALGSGGITFFIWLILMSKDFAFTIERAVTVMVITCPQATAC